VISLWATAAEAPLPEFQSQAHPPSSVVFVLSACRHLGQLFRSSDLHLHPFSLFLLLSFGPGLEIVARRWCCLCSPLWPLVRSRDSLDSWTLGWPSPVATPASVRPFSDFSNPSPWPDFQSTVPIRSVKWSQFICYLLIMLTEQSELNWIWK